MHFLLRFNRCRKLRVFCVNFLPWNLRSCKSFDKFQVWFSLGNMCCPSSIKPQRTSFLFRWNINLIQVCPSCRAFFRRSVQSGYNDSFKCTQGRGNCEVTLVTRKNCQYCRCHLLQHSSSLSLSSHWYQVPELPGCRDAPKLDLVWGGTRAQVQDLLFSNSIRFF